MLQGNLIIRNVIVGGNRTSVRLEHAGWSALDQVANNENMTVHQLCTVIDNARTNGSSRTSMIRAFIVSYFRAAANGAAMEPGMAKRVLNQAE